MRILHIGDLHFKAKRNNYDQNQMVAKMVEKLKNEKPIDLVLFTGDLVHSGTKYEDFNGAHKLLFEQLKTALPQNLTSASFHICAGNHDINRAQCSKAIINLFGASIKTNDELNDFIQKRSKDLETSYSPSTNFFNYQRDLFNEKGDEFHPLYSIQKRIVEGKKVAIVSLNSAWLSSEFNPDLNNLLFPTLVVELAIDKIKDCQLKILLIHHPLTHLKEYNYIALQGLIHKEFDLMLSGHVHREQISASYTANNGIYCNTTQATLTYDKEGEIGYSIINIENGNSELVLERATFIKKEKTFNSLPSVIVTMPCGEEKYKQNKLREKITSKYRIELDNANQLLLKYDEENDKNFIEQFTSPILSKSAAATAGASTTNVIIDFNTIVHDKQNYLIFGTDKCGKTSLLKYIQLQLLKDYPLYLPIPFYIDYKEYENKQYDGEFTKLISNYYEINNADTLEIVEKNKLIILIDNFSPAASIHKKTIEFLDKHKECRFIICSDNVTSRMFIEELDDLEYEKIYFKDLTRKELRLFTEKQTNIKKDDKELALEQITKLCKQLQLPLNYWTISLITLIYQKSKDDYTKNLYGVLDLCVDEMLNKKQLLLNKGGLKFEQYKELCSQLAYHLLVNHQDSVYSAEYNELIEFITKYAKKNPRLVGDPQNIFNFLFEAGILKKKFNRYTFRLNGVFEYFLAYYIKENPEFKEDILSNDSIYLNFKNELEIYSGFNRKDENFLRKVYEKTRTVYDQAFPRFANPGDIDNALMAKIGEAETFADNLKKMKLPEPLKHEIQDAIRDKNEPLNTMSEVHLKEEVNITQINTEVLEKYVSIIARVFKNSDGIENVELIHEIFDYILECYCNLGFYLIGEIEKYARTENQKQESEEFVIGEELLKSLSRFIPVLTETLLYDGLGHINLKTVIIEKIEHLKKDAKNNQYKLFLLYFLLIDCDLKTNKHYIAEVFENVKLSVLKVSTLFKLYFYLSFKAYKNKDLEAFFKKQIQTAKLKLDSGADIGAIQSGLAKRTKSNSAKAQSEGK